MIVNPNERPETGNLKDTTGKKPRWKKVLLIVLVVHLVYTLLDACSIQAPCAHWLIESTGPGQLVIDHLEYRVRPRQNELEMTWTESVIRGRSHWGEGEKQSRTIPLDPMPPEFARCYVDVTVDPDAPAMFPMPFGSDLLAPIPYLGEENVIGTDPDISTGSGHLSSDMVVHLRVRPEDVSALSEQFYVTISKYNGTLLVPYSKAGNGRREMLMTTPRDDDPRPYYNELLWDAESRPHKMPSRFWGMLKRIVLMPIVVIPDYVAIINNMFWGIWILHQLSNVDW